MWNLIEGAGIFAYPLILCSVLGVFIIFERLFALRDARVIPQDIMDDFLEGRLPAEADESSVVGRILSFFRERKPDAEQLKAFARLEVVKMERGLFILDIVVAAAPLLGLLGTVTGLVKVFARIDPESGMPDPGAFVEGVAMALTTTMLGLAIAIPALVFNSYLNRRIDSLAAQINVGIERIVAVGRDRR
jgi:biopolymer transport protein ExbB